MHDFVDSLSSPVVQSILLVMVVCTYGSGNLFLLIVALTRIYRALSDSIQFNLWFTF